MDSCPEGLQLSQGIILSPSAGSYLASSLERLLVPSDMGLLGGVAARPSTAVPCCWRNVGSLDRVPLLSPVFGFILVSTSPSYRRTELSRTSTVSQTPFVAWASRQIAAGHQETSVCYRGASASLMVILAPCLVS